MSPCPQSQLSLVLVPLQLNSPMNSVTSTEDIKPPLGLNGVLKVPAHPSGTMASFTKHICAICGDRSSGEAGTCPGRGSGQRAGGVAESWLWLPGSWQHGECQQELSFGTGPACASLQRMKSRPQVPVQQWVSSLSPSFGLQWCSHMKRCS